MGNKSSTSIAYVEKYVEDPKKLERCLCSMKNEVIEQERLITENIVEEMTQVQDAIIMRYSELKDKNKILGDIKEICKDEAALKFLTNAAEKMIAVFNRSSEMKDLMRWNRMKKVVKCDTRTVGMELHYKVMITEEKTGMIRGMGLGSTDTIVIIAFKFIQNALDVDPDLLPSSDKLKTLEF